MHSHLWNPIFRFQELVAWLEWRKNWKSCFQFWQWRLFGNKFEKKVWFCQIQTKHTSHSWKVHWLLLLGPTKSAIKTAISLWKNKERHWMCWRLVQIHFSVPTIIYEQLTKGSNSFTKLEFPIYCFLTNIYYDFLFNCQTEKKACSEQMRNSFLFQLLKLRKISVKIRETNWWKNLMNSWNTVELGDKELFGHPKIVP